MSDPSGVVHLVRTAVLSRYTGDCEWINEKTRLRVLGDPDNQGLTPAGIKKLLQDHVRGGGFIHCKEETGIWRNRRDFVYWAVIPVAGIDRGLFVEIELADADPTDPRVLLLNAHPASI